MTERYEDAWHIRSERDSAEYGVLIRCRSPKGSPTPWWWLICPAAATVYLAGETDLSDCSAPGCQWEDVHAAATLLVRELAEQEATRPSGLHPAVELPTTNAAERAILAAVDGQRLDAATVIDRAAEKSGLPVQALRAALQTLVGRAVLRLDDDLLIGHVPPTPVERGSTP